MRRNDKTWMETDEPLAPFLPGEDAEIGAAEAAELRARLVKLEQQVLSQYAAMAAFATIAKQDAEGVKVEARADLDRSQSTVIGLMEKLRNEANARLDRLEGRSSTGEPSSAHESRLTNLETELAATTIALRQCLQENQELRATLSVLVQQHMQEQGWLVSSGTSDDLSLT